MQPTEQQITIRHLSAKSETNLALHTDALQWQTHVSAPHAVAWLEPHHIYGTLQVALQTLFAAENFPDTYPEQELRYERDLAGKPYVSWNGTIAEWASARGLTSRHLHISNTHDGGAHIVVAAYDPDLVGLGIDAVYLPRLMGRGKDAVYLRRFAARFMSVQEQAAFDLASAQEGLEAIRLRAAAHFSLMEAASKACGTGLKIGVGMGRVTSLPKQSLGVLALAPNVELLFEGDAVAQLEALGACRAEAYYSADATLLISLVLLWKTL